MSQPFLPHSLLCSWPSLLFLSFSHLCLALSVISGDHAVLSTRIFPTHSKMWLHLHRLTGLAGKRQRKKGQDSNVVYQEATWVYSLLPLYENDYPLSHRPYHCQAGENSAILSMSKLRPEEGHSLLEVSRIVAEEDADAVSPRDVMQGGCSIRLLAFRWMS